MQDLIYSKTRDTVINEKVVIDFVLLEIGVNNFIETYGIKLSNLPKNASETIKEPLNQDFLKDLYIFSFSILKSMSPEYVPIVAIE